VRRVIELSSSLSRGGESAINFASRITKPDRASPDFVGHPLLLAEALNLNIKL
jgi:hypothetical protein